MILAAVINSCEQDLLDIPQRGAINTDEYYANASDDEAQALIAYIYKQIYATTSFGWISMWAQLANDIDGPSGGAYSNVGVSSSNHPSGDLFTALYRMNYLCNMIIEKLNEDTDEKTIVKGEAYFWRAWANMYLIQAWGTPPLVDHLLDLDELEPDNGNPDDLWNYVETSLQEAINRLPAKASMDGQVLIGGRVTKHSAYALLGKAQLWKGDYSGAISSLGTVISSNLYGLINDFSDLYHPQSDYCEEYIWEWNIEDSDVANYTYENDRRTIQMGWRSENVQQPGGLHIGFGAASNYTKDFYDFMIAHGEKDKARYLGTVWDYENILDKFIELEGAANRTEAVSQFWQESPILANSQGYLRAKMYIYRDEVFPYSADQDIYTKANWPGMRYAEVLLNYAEACALSGSNTTEGLAALNEVRARAGFNTLSSLNLQDVKDEKRAELVLEGDRFLDLIRWGDASTELDGRGFYTYSFLGYQVGTDPENGSPADYLINQEAISGAQNFVTGRDELFPFPYTEVLQNVNLDQNPNWQ